MRLGDRSGGLRDKEHKAFKIPVISQLWLNFSSEIENWGDEVSSLGIVVEDQSIFSFNDGGIITLET